MLKERKFNTKNDNNMKTINQMNDSKKWIFENYIGGYFPSKLNKSLDHLKNNMNNNTENINPMLANNINKYKSENTISLFNLKTIEKEIQDRYRRDLLNQIEENERRKKAKKREIEEENKINEMKYKEYSIYKQRQEEEYERIRKMYKNKKMKSQFGTEEQNILYNNNKKFEENEEKKEKINEIKNKEEKEKRKKIERKKEEITNNYNRIIKSNYLNMFEEKEELKNYIDKEYNDFLFIADDINNNNDKIDENILVNDELRESIDNNNNLKKENNRYKIYNDRIHKNVDKKYNYIFDKISYINDLTRSYKIKMEPSMYFNHKIDILLDSYSNMIINNNRQKNNYLEDKINTLSKDIKKEESLKQDIKNEQNDKDDDINEKENEQNENSNKYYGEKFFEKKKDETLEMK